VENARNRKKISDSESSAMSTDGPLATETRPSSQSELRWLREFDRSSFTSRI